MILADVTNSWDFSLNNFNSVWSLVCQIGLLLIFLFLGNLLRRGIPFLRKMSFPSALIGGILLLLTDYISKKCGLENGIVQSDVMKTITYHSLAIGFIAMSLRRQKTNKKVSGVNVIQNGLVTGGTYMIQGAFGILIGLIFFWIGKTEFYDSGVLLPLAFGQGPGNALTWGSNFANPTYMKDINAAGLFSGGDTVGTTLASIGFIVSAVVGVAYINIFKKSGAVKGRVKLEVRKVEEFIEEGEIEDSDSVDKFSIQLCLVGIAYAMAFGMMCLLSFTKFTNSLAWGFNFIFGVISATLVKNIVNFFEKKKVAKQKYINNYQMERISGFAFDMMIIAGVATIDLDVLKGYLGLIIILSIVGTIVTYSYVRLMSKYAFKDIQHEMFLVNFGTLTGTASNGMILLREIDPNFETNSSDIFIISQFPAMVAVAPMLLILNFGAKDVKTTIITMFIFLALAILYTVIIILLPKISSKKIKNK